MEREVMKQVHLNRDYQISTKNLGKLQRKMYINGDSAQACYHYLLIH